MKVSLRNPNGKNGPKLWSAEFDTASATLTIQFGSEGSKLKSQTHPNSSVGDIVARAKTKMREGYEFVTQEGFSAALWLNTDVNTVRLETRDAAVLNWVKASDDAICQALGFQRVDRRTIIDPERPNDRIVLRPPPLCVNAGSSYGKMAGLIAAISERFGVSFGSSLDVIPTSTEIILGMDNDVRRSLSTLGFSVPVDSGSPTPTQRFAHIW